MKVYSLFEGRHNLPDNAGPLCLGFNFETKKVERSELWEEAIETVRIGGQIGIYVTGLTPALTEFLSAACYVYANIWSDSTPNIILFHYDAVTKQYWKQQF